MKIVKVYFKIACFLITSYSYAINYEYSGPCKGYLANFEHCLEEEVQKYDQELNEQYQKLLKFNPDQKLRKIEQTWVKYKELDCRYMADEVHGSQYYQFIYNACVINKTKTRIAELKRSYFYSGWFKKRHEDHLVDMSDMPD